MDNNINDELSEVFNIEVYDNPLVKNEEFLAGDGDLDTNGDDNAPDAK